MPPGSPEVGIEHVEINDHDIVYGYAWLGEADWALITQGAQSQPGLFSGDFKIACWPSSFPGVLLATYFRARRLVRIEEERDQTRLQLVHSAKLASVG